MTKIEHNARRSRKGQLGRCGGSADKSTHCKPDDLGWIPRMHTVEGEKSSYKFSSDLYVHALASV